MDSFYLVIVESYKNTPALNEDSVLFNKNRNSVGKVSINYPSVPDLFPKLFVTVFKSVKQLFCGTKRLLVSPQVFEIFGPVCQPYYVLRFNSHDDIDQKDVKVRDPVYFAPKIKDFTDYIFTERLHE